MISMPRRSVTRYFIPLIDVLLLLFCVFLLMPVATEEVLDKRDKAAEDLSKDLARAERTIARLKKDLALFEELRPQLEDLARLREEIERLRQEKKTVLQRTSFQIIDIDGKTGQISYYDARKPKQARIPITNSTEARELIERHQEEAKGQEVYYYFLYPRPRTGRPTVGQETEYMAWFAKVPNSLKETP